MILTPLKIPSITVTVDKSTAAMLHNKVPKVIFTHEDDDTKCWVWARLLEDGNIDIPGHYAGPTTSTERIREALVKILSFKRFTQSEHARQDMYDKYFELFMSVIPNLRA